MYGRFVRWQIESRLKEDVTFDWIGDAKLVVGNGMTGATGNVYCCLNEFADMGFLLHLLRKGDLFIDVGANIGSYSTWRRLCVVRGSSPASLTLTALACCRAMSQPAA